MTTVIDFVSASIRWLMRHHQVPEYALQDMLDEMGVASLEDCSPEQANTIIEWIGQAYG